MDTVNGVPVNRELILSLIPDSIIGTLLQDYPEETQFELPKLTPQDIEHLNSYLEGRQTSIGLTPDVLRYLGSDLLDILLTKPTINSIGLINPRWIQENAQSLAKTAVEEKNLPLFRYVITRASVNVDALGSELTSWKRYEPIELALQYGKSTPGEWNNLPSRLEYGIDWYNTPDYQRYYYLFRSVDLPIPQGLQGRVIREANIDAMTDMAQLPSFKSHDEKSIGLVIREASYNEDVSIIREILRIFNITPQEIVNDSYWFVTNKVGLPILIEELNNPDVNITKLRLDANLFYSLLEVNAYSVLQRIILEGPILDSIRLSSSDNYGQLFAQAILPLLQSSDENVRLRGYHWLDLLMKIQYSYSSSRPDNYSKIIQLISQPEFPVERYDTFIRENIGPILRVTPDLIVLLRQLGVLQPFSLKYQSPDIIKYLLENGFIEGKDRQWEIDETIMNDVDQQKYDIPSLLLSYPNLYDINVLNKLLNQYIRSKVLDTFTATLDYFMRNHLFQPELFNYDTLFTANSYNYHITENPMAYIASFFRLANKYNLSLPPIAWASLIYYLIKNNQEDALLEMRTWKIFDPQFYVPFTRVM